MKITCDECGQIKKNARAGLIEGKRVCFDCMQKLSQLANDEYKEKRQNT